MQEEHILSSRYIRETFTAIFLAEECYQSAVFKEQTDIKSGAPQSLDKAEGPGECCRRRHRNMCSLGACVNGRICIWTPTWRLW